MNSRNTRFILSWLSVLASMLLSPSIYGRGGGVSFGPDGKMQSPNGMSEEEYRKFPGENQPWKIGDKWVVPNIVGYSYDRNRDRLSSDLRKFKIGKVKRIPSNKPRGEILSQSPKAGELLPNPGLVDLEVSDGPR